MIHLTTINGLRAEFEIGSISDRVYVYLYPPGGSKFRSVAEGDARTARGAFRLAKRLARSVTTSAGGDS